MYAKNMICNLEAVPRTTIIVSREFYDLTLDFLGP